MPSKEHFRSVVDSLKPVIAGVRDDALTAPTPCTDYRVRDLANHLLGTSEALRRVGAGEELDPADPWGTAGDHMGADWRRTLAAQLSGLADGWSRDEPWSDAQQAGTGDMALVEVMLHGWDLARGAGQRVRYDDAAVARADAILGEIGQSGRDAGIFGPEVTLTDEASAFDRMLAKSGRDARWAPPGTAP
jgi:uncharacterized protein (TIGR03086 family)